MGTESVGWTCGHCYVCLAPRPSSLTSKDGVFEKKSGN